MTFTARANFRQGFQVYTDSSRYGKRGDSLNRPTAGVTHGNSIASTVVGLVPQGEHLPSTESSAQGVNRTTPTTRYRLRSALSNNTLKANSKPRSTSRQGHEVSAPNVLSSGQKRRMADGDIEQRQNSPKLRRSRSRIDKEDLSNSNDGLPYILGPHGEPPLSGILARPSKFQEGSMNDRISRPPPGTIVGPELIESDIMDMDIDIPSTIQSSSVIDSTAENTPRSSPMYNFDATARSWNPFRFIGSLFGRGSDGTSLAAPARPPLSSGDVIQQVGARIQGVDGRHLTELTTQQTQGVESQPSSAGPTNSRQFLRSNSNTVDGTIESSNLTPSLHGQRNASLLQDSSLSLPTPQIETVTVHPTHLHQIDTTGHATFRNRFSTALRSPTKSKDNIHSSVSPSKAHATRFSRMFGIREQNNNFDAMRWNESGSLHTLQDSIDDREAIGSSYRTSTASTLHHDSAASDMLSKALPAPPRFGSQSARARAG